MKDIMDAYNHVLKTFYDLVEKKDVSRKNMSEFVRVALFCRILCGCDSINALIRAEVPTFTFAILRTMIEASIDLEILSNDDANIDIIAYSFAEQERKQLSYFEKDARYSDYFQEGTNIRLRLDAAKDFIDKHNSIKNRTSIAEKFRMLDRVSDYYDIYGTLCRSTHNNIDKLIEDYTKNSEPKIHIHRVFSNKELTKYTDLALSTFIFAFNFVYFLFGLTEEQHNTILTAYKKYTQVSAVTE